MGEEEEGDKERGEKEKGELRCKAGGREEMRGKEQK